jgi:hypothetical protein
MVLGSLCTSVSLLSHEGEHRDHTGKFYCKYTTVLFLFMIQPPDGVCTHLSLAYLQEQIQTIGNNFLTIFYNVKPDSIKELT